jgi:hypothetical protein
MQAAIYGWQAIINGKNSVPAVGRRYNAFIYMIKEVQTHKFFWFVYCCK